MVPFLVLLMAAPIWALTVVRPRHRIGRWLLCALVIEALYPIAYWHLLGELLRTVEQLDTAIAYSDVLSNYAAATVGHRLLLRLEIALGVVLL